MTTDPAAPPPVALTQERIAQLNGLMDEAQAHHVDEVIYLKIDEIRALLSAASSGAEAREMVEELQTLVAYSAKLAIDREQRAAAAEARVAVLTEALAPFSIVADNFVHDPDKQPIVTTRGSILWLVEDVRRARAALSPAAAGREGG